VASPDATLPGAAGHGPTAVLTPREASVFAAIVDAVAAPEPPLPPVAATDAVPAFDRWLQAAPPLNRAALRVLLNLAGLVRVRRMSRERRLALLARLGAPADALRSAAAASYWGDEGVQRAVGYDAAARVHDARERRRRELA
jgi:hypothetical protein